MRFTSKLLLSFFLMVASYPAIAQVDQIDPTSQIQWNLGVVTTLPNCTQNGQYTTFPYGAQWGQHAIVSSTNVEWTCTPAGWVNTVTGINLSPNMIYNAQKCIGTSGIPAAYSCSNPLGVSIPYGGVIEFFPDVASAAGTTLSANSGPSLAIYPPLAASQWTGSGIGYFLQLVQGQSGNPDYWNQVGVSPSADQSTNVCSNSGTTTALVCADSGFTGQQGHLELLNVAVTNGTNPTLNVNSQGAVPLVTSPGVPIPLGYLSIHNNTLINYVNTGSNTYWVVLSVIPVLPITGGGTGCTTAPCALANLGAAPVGSTVTVPIADPNGNGVFCSAQFLSGSLQIVGTTCIHNYFPVITEGGQSLASGSLGTPALSTTQPYNNVMLTPSVSYTNLPVIPLVETSSVSYDGQVNVETTSSSMANYIAAYYIPTIPHVRVGVGLHSLTGTAYAGIAPTTPPYIRGVAQLQSFKTTALTNNWDFSIFGEAFTHGETDYQSGNGTYISDSNPHSVYEGNLESYQPALLASAQLINPTTATYPLVLSQMNAGWTGEMAQTQWQACKDNPTTIFCSSPKYFLTAATGNLHLINTSYKLLGEYYAKAILSVHTTGSWTPLQMSNSTVLGSVVTVNFNIPVAPLVLDTTLVWPHTNYGFEYFDATSSRTISSVAKSGNQVNVTLSGAPGANAWVGYAMTCPAGGVSFCASTNHTVAADANYVGGNIRDSDTTVSLSSTGTGISLYNWLMSGKIPIPSVPAAPTVSATVLGLCNTCANVTFSTFNISSYPITNVCATSSPGSIVVCNTVSPLMYTTLTTNTAYTFNVTATNTYGTSAAATTNSVTPVVVTVPAPTAEWFVTANYNDNSGNGHTATAAGSGTTFITDPIGGGVHGTVASLNGSGYATTTVAQNTSYSECGWAYPTNAAQPYTILGTGTGTGDQLYIANQNTGGANSLWTLKGIHEQGSGLFSLNVQNPSAMTINSWYRVCLTYDGSRYFVYVNGVQVGTSGGFWQQTTAYALGSLVLDAAGHIQKVSIAGTSGSSIPTFNDLGATTVDGTVTWSDIGLSTVGGRTGGNMYIAGNNFGASFNVGYLHKVDYWASTVLTSAQIVVDATQN